jgi:hypothetical protein
MKTKKINIDELEKLKNMKNINFSLKCNRYKEPNYNKIFILFTLLDIKILNNLQIFLTSKKNILKVLSYYEFEKLKIFIQNNELFDYLMNSFFEKSKN